MITILDYKEIYNRLSSGKPFDNKLKPYSEIILERLLNNLELNEEYEKCQIVKQHLDKMNHDLGFRMDIVQE